MLTHRCQALLFDLDGVLIDSTPAVARVWKRWALEHGFDPNETIRRAHGRPSISTVREYLPRADHAAENREIERREIADIKGIVPLPGALALLQSLPHERWAIVTSCTRPLAIVRIRAAGLPEPRNLITSTDVQRGKPDPEPFLKGAALLGFPPQSCVVVEDAAAGVVAGKAAGAHVIALRTTAPDQDLLRAGASWIVNDCSSLSALATPADSQLALRIATADVELPSGPEVEFQR